MTDADALSRYQHDGSHDAFELLVRRHVDLVYSVARRHVNSPQLAEDIAQSVFIELSQNARAIKPGTPLVAWLHVVSRRLALNAIRDETRRLERERQATLLAEMKSDTPDWNAIEPLLDEAVASLPDQDRAAILLRYFEQKSLRDVGAALGTSDDAAQKRVSRALDQLRAFLAGRGVVVTAAGLTTDLFAHALITAPASLTPAIVTTASTTAVATATHTGALLTFTAMPKTVFLSAALVAAAGGSLYEGNRMLNNRRDLAVAQARAEALLANLREAGRQLADTEKDLGAARARLAAVTAGAEPIQDVELATLWTVGRRHVLTLDWIESLPTESCTA